MARPRTYKTEGVVLKQMSLSEADRILTLYTPDLGKLRALGKGIRRTRSRLGGHLDLLTHSSISLSIGKNLDVVTEAQTVHSFRSIREDLQRLASGIYLAELVDGFSVEDSPNTDVYYLLLNTLKTLANTNNTDLLLRFFELHLLRQSGFAPQLNHCVECLATLEPADHLFACTRGGILCPQCHPMSNEITLPLSLGAIKVLRFIERENYESVKKLQLSRRLLHEVENLLVTCVRYVVEKDLRSTTFINLVKGKLAKAKTETHLSTT